MAGRGFGGQLGKLFQDMKEKATETVARQEAAFVRGKVAGSPVKDDDGEIIVDAGHLIDEAVIARAERAGKLGALVMSAGTAQVQDLREKASDTLAKTQDGTESRNLASVEEFREAMAYVGRYAGMDVTDIRGNIIVPQGKRIDAEDVRAARDENLLSSLIYSAQQGQAPAPEPSPLANEPGYQSSRPAAPAKRAALPLVGPEDEPASKQ
jgi:hypothetical protein